jgi:hypothetical protein
LVFFHFIAQHNVNGSTLTIEMMNITSPTPNSFELGLQSRIANTGIISATLDSMNLTMSTMQGNVLGYISVPEVHATPGGADLSVSQNFVIHDIAAFEDFNLALLRNQTAQFQVKGETTLHALGQKTDVKFDKILSMPGASSLIMTLTIGLYELTNITIPKFDLPAQINGGIEMVSTSVIDNPSHVGVFLGNTTLGLSFKGVTIANVTANNFDFVPGTNSVSMGGVLLASAFVNNTRLANELFSAVVAGDPVNMIVFGIGTKVNGQNIPWLSKLVTAINSPIILTRAKSELLKQLTLSNITLSLTTDGGTMSSDINADIQCTTFVKF